MPATAEREPPQLLIGAGDAAITRPAVRISGNATAVSGVEPVFLMVRVSVETDPTGTGLGEKALLTLTPGRLVSVAWAAIGLLAPLNVVTAPIGMAFVRSPFTVVVALRVRVQVALAARLPPLNENVLAPETPVSVPPQLSVFRLAGVAMIMPAGMASVKAIPVRRALLGLVSWTLRVDTEPPYTSRGEKALFTVMDKAAMESCAWACARGEMGTPARLALTFDVGIVLVRVPVAPFPCTSTLMVQIPAMVPTCAGTIPPVSVIELAPASAVRLPPQLVLAFGAGATTTLFGELPIVASESVTFKLVSAEVFVLVSVIVSVEDPFGLIVVG